MTEEGIICPSSIETHTKSTRKGKERQDQTNGVGNASVADSILVANDKPPIASNERITQLFKAKRQKDPRLRNNNKEVYPVEPVLKMIRGWDENDQLSPRSDMGALQYRDVKFKVDGNYEVKGVTLLARNPKEIDSKQSKLGAIREEKVCPVRTLWRFVDKTQEFRRGLKEDHTLFSTYLSSSDKEKGPVSAKTIGNWVKEALKEAGINTEIYKAHSLRAAASTEAVLKGATFQEVKIHGNWSQNSNTVEDYYFRPPNQHEAGRMNEFFNLRKTKIENVVGARPWTMPWHWLFRPKRD
ncbi:hypothetical protein A0J61_01461 [Choanephora cucurbitarum]|uniref:Tyr recombinase domain-containing protein n=1 Tax=Choanephora cucurbitarum TaxID=101091 RepID=A0A1C7NMZ6_9FUNG|nr:hypothetical protein A0J61_01461 [Choanephora cucurbitarum]